jgi:enoyl-CoA hydratase/carnithine racemase
MSEAPLLVERREDVVWLTLNRQQRRNALSLELLQRMAEVLDRLREDRASRVVVISANGPVFSSGHDLSEMHGRSADHYEELFGTCTRVMLGLRTLPQPTIAKVQGLATAAGCQLAAACDLVVAAEEARFATPGVKIGLFCTTPMVPLVRSIQPKRALEMLLTGRPISAEEAREAGLVTRVAPADQLDGVISEWLTALLGSSGQTLAIGKQAFYDQLGLPEAEAYERAVRVMVDNAQTHDAQEGIGAFLKKTPPQWRHS